MDKSNPNQADIMTAQDSLEPTPASSTASVTPAPTTVKTATPAEQTDNFNYAGVRNRFFSRALILSGILMAFVAVLTVGALLLTKINHSRANSAQNASAISSQAIKLKGTSALSTSEPLRSNIPTLDVNGDISAAGILQLSNGNYSVRLETSDLTANQTITLPNASGEICVSSDNCDYVTPSQVQSATAFSGGSGIIVNNKQITNSGVISINGLNGAVSIQGSSSEISATINGGGIVLALPQAIGTGSTPTFGGLNLGSALGVASGGTGATTLTANAVLLGNGGGALQSVTTNTAGLCLTSTGGAPTFQVCPGASPQAVTVSSNGTANTLAKFTGNQTVANSDITDDGTTVNVNADLVSNNLTTSLLQSTGSLTVTSSGLLSLGTNNQEIDLIGNANSIFQAHASGFSSTLGFTAPTANRTILLPDASGTVCLQNSGNCGFAQSGTTVSSLDGLVGDLTINNTVGSGTAITINDASTAQKGIAQFNATDFSASGGVIDTIQGIATSATPQFAGLTLTGNLTLGTSGIVFTNNIQQTGSGHNISVNAGNDNIVFSNGGGANTFLFPTTGGVGQVICTTGVSCASGGGQAVLLEPGSAQTASANKTSIFVNKTGGTGNVIELQSSGTDALVVSNTGATTISSLAVTGTLNANTITPTGALTIGSNGQQFTLQGNGNSIITSSNGTFKTTIGFLTGSGGTAPTGNITYQFENDNSVAPGTYTVCTTVGNCGGGGGGVTSSSSTAGTIAMFSSATNITNSLLSQSSGTITDSGALQVTGAFGIAAGNSSTTGLVSLYDGTTSNVLTFNAATQSANHSITAPNASGTICLQNSASCGFIATGGAVTSLDGLSGALTLNNSSGAGSAITINNASTAQKGIAQFNATDFTVSSGTVDTIQGIATSSSPTFQNLILQGATGLTVGSTSNLGQINFKDGTADGFSSTFSPATLTASRTITIPNASGTIAIQATGNISLDSTGTVSLTGIIPIANGGTNGSAAPTAGAVAYGTGTAYAFTVAGSNNQVLISKGTSAPQFANISSLLSAGSNISLSGTTTATIATVNNPTFTTSVTTPLLQSSGALTITPAGLLTIGATGQTLILQGSASTKLTATSGGNTATLSFTSPTGTDNIVLPDASGTVCLQASSACGFTTGTGTAFIQGGNSFGTTALLGTNDANTLNVETNGQTRLTVLSGGSIGINNTNPGNPLTVNTPSTADSLAQLFVSSGVSTNKGVVIQGVASQTANLLEIQNNSGSTEFAVTAAGSIFYGPAALSSITYDDSSASFVWRAVTAGGVGTITIDPDSTLNLGTGITGNINVGRSSIDEQILVRGKTIFSNAINTDVTVTVKGAASQAADLQDWENSASTVLLEVTQGGVLQGGNGSGTNISGRNLVLAGGQGTGTGSGGNVNFQIAAPGSSSSLNNSEATVASLSGTTGAALFQNSVNAVNAFQIQNTVGTNELNVNNLTNNGNIWPNPDFEQNTNGVAARTGATLGLAQPSPSQFGRSALAVTFNGTTNQGVQFVDPVAPNTTYSISFWAELASGTSGTWTIGRNEAGADASCTTGRVFTGTWTQYTCVFTSGSTVNSSANLFISQSGTASSAVVYIDGFTLVASGSPQSFVEPATELQVEPFYNNLSINQLNSGEVQQWELNGNNLPLGRSNAGVISANGYIYIAGGGTGVDGTSPGNTVYSAAINADGSVGAFATNANSLGTAERGAGAVSVDNYMYLIGGKTSAGSVMTTVQFAKLGSSGTTSAWGTTTALPVGLYSPVVFSSGGYIYVAGGNSGSTDVTTVYYGKVNADGTISSWTTSANSLVTGVDATRGIVQNGYVYIIGGDTTNDTAASGHYQYATVSSTGGTGTWTDPGTNVFPGGLGRGDNSIASLNGYIYVIGGWDGSGSTFNYLNTTLYTRPNPNGTLQTFTQAANGLPNNMEEGKAVTANGYIYFVGGDNGTTGQTSVYYTSTARTKIAGSLDLVGTSDSGTLSGSGGGSLTAGSGTFLGSLTVQGQTALNSGLSVTGNFAVQNTSGANVLTVDSTQDNLTFQAPNNTATIGSEMITSQDFTNATYWTCPNWTTTTTTATATASSVSCATTGTNLSGITSGTTYQVTFTIANDTSNAGVSVTLGPGSLGDFTVGTYYANGTYSVLATAHGSSGLSFNPNGPGFSGSIISGISVKPVTFTTSAVTLKASDATTGLEIRTSTASILNTLIGTGAGRAVTSAIGLTAVGVGALQSDTTGTVNTAVGVNALQDNTTGIGNTAVGVLSLASNRIGSENTAVGGGFLTAALENNVSGSNNSAFGESALINNVSGSNNSALGQTALESNTIGNNDTALGYNAYYQDTDGFTSGTSLSNATAVGYNAEIQESNALILGATGSTAIKVGIGTTMPDNTLSVSGVQYNTGTASQTANVITGSGTTWTASMVGSELIFANGTKATITGFTDASHLTATPSQSVSSSNYRIQYNGLQVTGSGQLGLNNLAPSNFLDINTASTADSAAQGLIATGGVGNKGLVIQGSASQSANLQEWQSSTGVALAFIDASGNLSVKNATVTGTLTVNGNSTFNGTLSVNGHIISGNTSGTTTIVVGAAGGTGATASITGNDTAGLITINTGTGDVAGTLATITFANAYGSAPNIVLTPKDIPVSGIYPQYQYSSSTGSFTIGAYSALSDSGTYTFSYQIIQ